MSINTLKEFLKLKASGIPEPQAIAQVEAMFDMVDFKLEGLATKEDISGVLKDIFYIKLMLGGTFVVGAMPIIQQYLHIN